MTIKQIIQGVKNLMENGTTAPTEDKPDKPSKVLTVSQRTYLAALRSFLNQLNDILYRVHLHTCKGDALPKPGEISDMYARFEDTLKEWDKVLTDL